MPTPSLLQRLKEGKLVEFVALKMTRLRPCFLILLGVTVACEPTPPRGQVETVISWRPNDWHSWRDLIYVVSPDGTWASNFNAEGQVELVHLTTGQLDQERLLGDLDRVSGVFYYGEGKMARRGRRGDERGWFFEGPDGLVPSSFPGRPHSWSPDGSRIVSASGHELMIGLPEQGPKHELPGRVLGATWSPFDNLVYSLVWLEQDGYGALYSLEPETGEIKLVREPLDVCREPALLPLSSDGRLLYLALASEGAPDPEARHDLGPDRDLDIYQLDLRTGETQVLVDDPGDDRAPILADGWLYWTHNNYQSSIVFVPVSGGEPRLVLDEAECSRWHPSGRRLSFKYGGSRLVDAGLWWTVGAVDVDEDGNPASGKVPIVDGYNQDNWLAWSPDGEWVVYHSHRTPDPIAYFGEGDWVDDIFLRRAKAPQEEEIRLTDFGRETWNPDWSADGLNIVFTTFPVGEDGVTLWTINFDPETGEYGSAEGVPLPDDMVEVAWARWSPAGELAVVEVIPGPRIRALRIRDTNGSWSERLVEFDGRWVTLDWTPDGMNIIYSDMVDGRLQVFTIPRSGGNPRRLSSDDRHLSFPDVSPDGRWVALTRFDNSQELRRLRLR